MTEVMQALHWMSDFFLPEHEGTMHVHAIAWRRDARQHSVTLGISLTGDASRQAWSTPSFDSMTSRCDLSLALSTVLRASTTFGWFWLRPNTTTCTVKSQAASSVCAWMRVENSCSLGPGRLWSRRLLMHCADCPDSRQSRCQELPSHREEAILDTDSGETHCNLRSAMGSRGARACSAATADLLVLAPLTQPLFCDPMSFG